MFRHSPDARSARAAIVLDGIDNIRLRDIAIPWPTATQAPGWGEGLTRIENGGSGNGPAHQGDAVTFAGLWARHSSGSISFDQKRIPWLNQATHQSLRPVPSSALRHQRKK